MALAAVAFGLWGGLGGQVAIGLLDMVLFGLVAVVTWYWADATLQIQGRSLRVRNLRRRTALNLDQVLDCHPAAFGLVIVIGPRAQIVATVLETGWIPWLRPSPRARADAAAARILAEAASYRAGTMLPPGRASDA